MPSRVERRWSKGRARLRAGGVALVATLLLHGSAAALIHQMVIAPDLDAEDSTEPVDVELTAVPPVLRPPVQAPAPLLPEPEPPAPDLEPSGEPLGEDPPAAEGAVPGSQPGPATKRLPPIARDVIPLGQPTQKRSDPSLEPTRVDMPTPHMDLTPTLEPVRTRARVLKRARPAPPRSCRRRGHHGVVVISLVVSADGSPRDLKVQRSSGCRDLDRAARAAVQGYQFKAATWGGRAVASRERVEIRFQRPNT